MDLQALSDRIEITDLLTRYARAVDRREWGLYRSVFTEDAYIDYRSSGGVDGDLEKVASFLEEVMAVMPVTQHFVTNIECVIDGDTAKVDAMFYNPIQFPGFAEISFTGGYYHHRLVRTAEGWKSRELIEETSWFVNAPKGLTAGSDTSAGAGETAR